MEEGAASSETSNDNPTVVEVEIEEESSQSDRPEIQKRPIPNLGQLKSDAYLHFNWNNSERKWKCNYCPAKYIHSKKGGSSSLTNHLKSKHNAVYKKLKDENNGAPGESLSTYFQCKTPLSKQVSVPVNEANFKQRLVRFIIECGEPFSIVQHPAFVELVQFLSQNNERVKPPSDTTIKRWISESYNEEKAKLKNCLLNNEGKISCILDCWTSQNQKPFQGVVGSWINDKWEICNVPIDLTKLKGGHSGQNLAHAFSEVLTEYELWTKLLAVTTDNATNMDTSVGYRVRCMAHIINLACQDIIRCVAGTNEEVEDSFFENTIDRKAASNLSLVEKLRIAVRAIRSSPQRREILEKFCEKFGLEKKGVILDVSTRWNYTLKMLQRIKELRQPFLATVNHIKNLQNLGITDDEVLWGNIDEIIKLIEPFELATNILSQGYAPSLPDTAILFNMLFEHLEKYTNAQSIQRLRSRTNESNIPIWLQDAANAGWTKLQKYYAVNDDLVYVVATVMDPRYKLNWFKLCWKLEYYEAAKSKVNELWKTKYKNIECTEKNVASSSSSQIEAMLEQKMQKFHRADDELKRYLSEPCLNPKKSISGIKGALQWWKTHQDDFLILSRMAKDFLAVSATGVPVERFFSSGPDLLSNRRHGLSAQSI